MRVAFVLFRVICCFGSLRSPDSTGLAISWLRQPSFRLRNASWFANGTHVPIGY